MLNEKLIEFAINRSSLEAPRLLALAISYPHGFSYHDGGIFPVSWIGTGFIRR